MFDDTRGIDEALAAILWVGAALLVANAVGAERSEASAPSARVSRVRRDGGGGWRAVGGEMTGFDALWLLGVVAVGAASALRLRRHRLRERN